MSPVRTYLDSNVLFYAFNGEPKVSDAALQILDDPNREFVSSRFVILEVLPNAIYFQNQAEIDFYERFFKEVRYWAGEEPKSLRGLVTTRWRNFSLRRGSSLKTLGHIVEEGIRLGTKYGIAGIDAVHVAAAIAIGANELITGEKPTKPMFRVKELRVTSIQPK